MCCVSVLCVSVQPGQLGCLQSQLSLHIQSLHAVCSAVTAMQCAVQ